MGSTGDVGRVREGCSWCSAAVHLGQDWGIGSGGGQKERGRPEGSLPGFLPG